MLKNKNKNGFIPLDENDHGLQNLSNKTKKKILYKYLLVFLIIIIIFLSILFIVLFINTNNDNNNNTNLNSQILSACQIYCWGEILYTIQYSNIYNDSKTFVDMPMKKDPNDVYTSFYSYNINKNSDINLIQDFLNENFYLAGSDLLNYIPNDYIETPNLLNNIKNSSYQLWASSLNNLWLDFSKKLDNNVIKYPQRHSYLPKNYPIIIPGGRFRESYYWDSYWIIQGLLTCDMGETSLGIIRNFFYDIDNFGFIPNGGRIYYLTRSQPPMLSEMIITLYEWGQINENTINPYWPTEESIEPIYFLEESLNYLKIEYEYWMNFNNNHISNITYNNKIYTLNHYYGNTTIPRPESYIEDIENSIKKINYENKYNNNYNNNTIQQNFYKEITSGAETGWDFSSRWITKNISNYYPLYNINTTNIIPTDLNTILYRYELNIARIIELLNNPNKFNYKLPSLNYTNYETNDAIYYYNQSLKRLNAIQTILWSEKDLKWYDYNIYEKKNIKDISSISNYIPIWGNIIENDLNIKYLKNDIINCFNNSNLIQIGGILTTNITTKQQWDNPSAWPPLQLFIINGLNNLNTKNSNQLAKNLAINWLNTCYIGWNKYGYMNEKYDAYTIGESGSGGEYIPQKGFGWTNGVVLKLLDIYGNEID